MLLARAPAAGRVRRAVTRPLAITAPIEGWDAASALADMKPQRAVQLKNWFPQPGWIEVRKGYKYHAWNIVDDDTSIESLMSYHGATSSKLFAAGGGAVYDVTSNAAATSAITSLTSNRWQHTLFGNSAGTFLWMCNGVDAPRHYNGSTWATPSISGTGITASDFVQCWSHKARIWAVITGTQDAAYLETDAIAGTAVKFRLGRLFTRGGYLMAGTTWTRDGGSGPDDYQVFISSEGQVAVYAGTDPSSSNSWSIVGVFNVPKPIGRRCFARLGGDVLLITIEGVFPLSQLLPVDQSKASRVAITENINPAFNADALSHSSKFGWEICVYPGGTRLVVNIPTTELAVAKQYVMNTITGAWCEFDAHNANCWAVFNDNLYFGGQDGAVYRADTGRADLDQPILAVGQTAYQAFGTPSVKRFSMIRPLVNTTGSNRPSLGMSVDFVETSSMSSLLAATTSTGAVWDTAKWDVAVWADESQTVADWTNVVGIGTFGSIKFQAQTGQEVGRSIWGVSRWGRSLWGSTASSNETMRINGFIALTEAGGYL
jgi:hypothetical protein